MSLLFEISTCSTLLFAFCLIVISPCLRPQLFPKLACFLAFVDTIRGTKVYRLFTLVLPLSNCSKTISLPRRCNIMPKKNKGSNNAKRKGFRMMMTYLPALANSSEDEDDDYTSHQSKNSKGKQHHPDLSMDTNAKHNVPDSSGSTSKTHMDSLLGKTRTKSVKNREFARPRDVFFDEWQKNN